MKAPALAPFPKQVLEQLPEHIDWDQGLNLTPQNFSLHPKCILLGEHAVLHGVPGITIPLKNKLVTFTACFDPDQEASILINGVDCTSGLGLSLDKMEAVFSQIPLIPDLSQAALRHGLQIEITTDIPQKAGLGFSAIFSVGMIRILARMANLDLEQDAIARLANHLENLFHGTASGIDVWSVARSQPILFTQQERDAYTAEAITIPPSWRFFLMDTGTRTATIEMIERASPFVQQHLEEAHQCVNRFREAAQKNNPVLASQALGAYWELMRHWQLSTDRMDQFCAEAKNFGASAAKISGAGGGGYLLIFDPEGTFDLEGFQEHTGKDCFAICFSTPFS